MAVCKISIKTGLSFMILLVAIPAYAIPEKDTGNLGEIRQSILELRAFQRIYGEGWVLMDGRALRDEDDLFREGLWRSRNIPDARGVYLRSANQGRRTREGNPDGNAHACGAYLADQFKSHNHGGGNHCHSYNGGNGGGTVFGNHTCTVHNYGSNNYQTTSSGAIISSEGGAETRPRSVVVNTYIKINRTPESEQTRLFVETLRNIPRRILENERLRNVLRQMVNEAIQRPRNP